MKLISALAVMLSVWFLCELSKNRQARNVFFKLQRNCAVTTIAFCTGCTRRSPSS